MRLAGEILTLAYDRLSIGISTSPLRAITSLRIPIKDHVFLIWPSQPCRPPGFSAYTCSLSCLT